MPPPLEPSSSDPDSRWSAYRNGLIAVLGSGCGGGGGLVLAAKTGWPASPEARAWLTAGLMALAAVGLAWRLARFGRARDGRFDALGWLVLGSQVPVWLALLGAVGMLGLALFGGYRGN